MRCEHCGERVATCRVTEVVQGAFKELSLCETCAGPLSHREKDTLGCARCGSTIDLAEFRRTVDQLKSKNGLSPEALEAILKEAQCPICGEPVGLLHIPFELIQNPSFTFHLEMLASLRTRLKSGPGSLH